MPKCKYVGSPGYEFLFADRTIAPQPGDVVDLTDHEAATVGPDVFEPVKGKTPAPADDPKES